MFYGTPSKFLWEDELGVVNHIPQGEGGEQGDPLMPLLFSLGQHRALVSVVGAQGRTPVRLSRRPPCDSAARPSGRHPPLVGHPLVEPGKDHIAPRQDSPRGCHALEEAARREDPTAVVWRGNVLLEPRIQGLVVLGVPVGRAEYTLAKLEAKSRKHNVLLDRITSVHDLQSAWCLLLYCAAARANFWLRTVPPELSGDFAREHDASLW